MEECIYLVSGSQMTGQLVIKLVVLGLFYNFEVMKK